MRVTTNHQAYGLAQDQAKTGRLALRGLPGGLLQLCQATSRRRQLQIFMPGDGAAADDLQSDQGLYSRSGSGSCYFSTSPYRVLVLFHKRQIVTRGYNIGDLDLCTTYM